VGGGKTRQIVPSTHHSVEGTAAQAVVACNVNQEPRKAPIAGLPPSCPPVLTTARGASESPLP